MGLSPATLQTLQTAWQQVGVLHYFLRFLSFIYAGLLSLKQLFIQLGFIKTTHLPVKIIVVGNVIAGGAGKTPTVIAVVEYLQQKGLKVGIISRGYGRQLHSGNQNQALEIMPNTSATIAGDEPLLLKKICQVPVFVSTKRVAAAQALLAQYPETQIIVSDDGLQHTALPRMLEVIVFDDRGVGNGRLIPAGLLREKWPRTLTKQSSNHTLVLHTGQSPAFEGFYAQRQLQNFATNGWGQKKSLAEFLSSQHNALAAIASPNAFFEMLEKKGLTLQDKLPLADHDDFMNWHLPLTWQNTNVFCTEKDAVKLWPLFPEIWAIGLDFKPEKTFFDALDQAFNLNQTVN